MLKKSLLILFFSTFIFCDETIKYQKLPLVGSSELTTLKGEAIEFTDLYNDGPLLLSFWFLGCGPCVAEMKHLSKFNVFISK